MVNDDDTRHILCMLLTSTSCIIALIGHAAVSAGLNRTAYLAAITCLFFLGFGIVHSYPVYYWFEGALKSLHNRFTGGDEADAV